MNQRSSALVGYISSARTEHVSNIYSRRTEEENINTTLHNENDIRNEAGVCMSGCSH